MSGGFFLFLEHRKKERECTSVGVLGNDPNAHIPSHLLKIRKEVKLSRPYRFSKVRATMVSISRAIFLPTSH
jgi:hypothetical protein